MKTKSLLTQSPAAAIAIAFLYANPASVKASGKTTDTTSSTSSGGSGGGTSGGGGSTSSGGGSTSSGGVNSNKPTGGTTTAPAPIISSNLTFSASGPIGDVMPICTGSYRIDPYYPTLSLMTVSLQASSVNLPDGTLLYATVVTSNNPYGNSTGYIALTAQGGTCTISAYVVPGTIVAGVVISDASGNILLAGN